MALLLKEKGITRVRPLAGGLEAWSSRGYPRGPIPRPGPPAAETEAPAADG